MNRVKKDDWLPFVTAMFSQPIGQPHSLWRRDAIASINLAFPWAYISIGDAVGFNDYIHHDTSTVSDRNRSDVTNTFDIMVTKALGDFVPFLDPNKNLFLNFSYEKIISEANIMNYDYISDSYAFSFSKSFQLNK